MQVARTEDRLLKHLPLMLMAMLFTLLIADVTWAHGMSEEEKQSIIDGGNWSYLWLGATHMLSGYDHLAFVFGIIFFLTSFRDIAKYVTAFTIGHSVTLIYATFNAIQLNYFLIDAIIALSVCYIAFANLDGCRKYLNVKPPNMTLMITGLGLIHGFGLSTRLQMLPLSEDQLLMNIISFNIGVELGQISALFGMLLLLAAWRHTAFFQSFSIMTNYFLILLGLFLFLMQMHGYEHTTNEELMQGSATAMQEKAAAGNPDEIKWQDTVEINLPARGDLEYKFLVSKGKGFSYYWKTNGEPLFYDFHGEPTNDTSGYFESFGKDTRGSDTGSLTAGFTGTHGWYWKNNSTSNVTITLKLSGDYQLKSDKPAPDQALDSEQPPRKKHESIF
jgi:hypothetical protein